MAQYPPAVERWRPLVAEYFPPQEVDRALYIIQRESGGDPGVPSVYNARGTEDSWGLFQINLDAHPLTVAQATDPRTNVAYAAQLWSGSGWQPWKTASGSPDFPPALGGIMAGPGNPGDPGYRNDTGIGPGGLNLNAGATSTPASTATTPGGGETTTLNLPDGRTVTGARIHPNDPSIAYVEDPVTGNLIWYKYDFDLASWTQATGLGQQGGSNYPTGWISYDQAGNEYVTLPDGSRVPTGNQQQENSAYPVGYISYDGAGNEYIQTENGRVATGGSKQNPVYPAPGPPEPATVTPYYGTSQSSALATGTAPPSGASDAQQRLGQNILGNYGLNVSGDPFQGGAAQSTIAYQVPLLAQHDYQNNLSLLANFGLTTSDPIKAAAAAATVEDTVRAMRAAGYTDNAQIKDAVAAAVQGEPNAGMNLTVPQIPGQHGTDVVYDPISGKTLSRKLYEQRYPAPAAPTATTAAPAPAAPPNYLNSLDFANFEDVYG